jgi:cytochrome c biogenesis protein CcmG, thiol:disulfide interchange protein DsbE
MIVQQEPHQMRRRWPFIILVVCIVGLALVVLWRVLSPFSSVHTESLLRSLRSHAAPVGRPAPDFTRPMLSGGALSLHSLRGKPIVLNFWASWCGPCLAETPLLVRLEKVYGPRGVVFVGADVTDDVSDARRFVGQHHVDYLVIRADDRMVRVYGVVGLPTTVFIRADGVVADEEVGGFSGSGGEEELRSRLDQLLAPTSP